MTLPRFAGRHKLLAALVVVAGVLTVANIAARTAAPAVEDAEAVVVRYERLLGSAATQPAETKAGAADPRIERLVERHPFSPDPPKREFKAVLNGVLGQTAYLDGGNGVGVGDTHNGAKVLEVGPDWVRLQFEGQPHTLYVFGAGGGPTGGGPSPPPRPAMAGRPHPGPSAPPPRPRPRPAARSPEDMPSLTPEQLAQIRAALAQMSPEEREEALAQAPEHIRKQLEE